MPRAEQLTRKELACRTLVPAQRWLPTAAGPDAAFRNKAKMVVAGTVDQPTLGILGPNGSGVDLRDCGLHAPGLQSALPSLARFVTRAGLTPYDVPARRGELKLLIATESPDGELMVRFVLRSQEPVARIRKHLPQLLGELPGLRVVTVNLQPEHKAVLEGEREIVLTEAATLPMRVNDVTLQLHPQGFFQTNTLLAAALYQQARDWANEVGPRTVWDLYCGVGGFAAHLVASDRSMLGVEVSVGAVEGARAASGPSSGPAADFVAADATAYAIAAATSPDLVVVNPPRRGIGPELAGWLDQSTVGHVIYSSCNATTLARDLAAMPAFQVSRARMFDMFPQTDHYEVMVLLERSDRPD
uniref:methyltransferase domain-containing protein n=1 Tax=Nocardioides terrisoli TaxID=3388267 RepID=UPI0037C94585